MLCSRVGTPFNQRDLAVRGVEAAAAVAGLGKVTPQDHSLNVWTRHYARSFGKAQRDEARARLLEHGFGAAPSDQSEPERKARRREETGSAT